MRCALSESSLEIESGRAHPDDNANVPARRPKSFQLASEALGTQRCSVAEIGRDFLRRAQAVENERLVPPSSWLLLAIETQTQAALAPRFFFWGGGGGDGFFFF